MGPFFGFARHEVKSGYGIARYRLNWLLRFWLTMDSCRTDGLEEISGVEAHFTPQLHRRLHGLLPLPNRAMSFQCEDVKCIARGAVERGPNPCEAGAPPSFAAHGFGPRSTA